MPCAKKNMDLSKLEKILIVNIWYNELFNAEGILNFI